MSCKNCMERRPVYDMSLICCNVRYILGLKTKSLRRYYLTKLIAKSPEMGEIVKEEVRKAWSRF